MVGMRSFCQATRATASPRHVIDLIAVARERPENPRTLKEKHGNGTDWLAKVHSNHVHDPSFSFPFT